MAALEISLLGDVRLAHAGTTIRCPGEKAMLLLARLASPPGVRHRREVLQARLWPEADRRRAQGALRFLLHRLRGTLGPAAPALAGDAASLWLDPNQVTVDTQRFETLAAFGTAEAVAEACALYRGDLLASCPGRLGGFDDWLLCERERLREIARTAFWTQFALLLWRGEAGEAASCAARYLEIDPYCERMHAALMRLHAAQGRRALAARIYARVAARLERDLQVPPGTALARLAAGLARGNGIPRRLDPAWLLGRDADSVLQDKPLVAVLPFRDLSEETPLVGLPAALTDDVIGDLARFRRLSVLGRHTSAILAGKADPSAWLASLGVGFTVEGSVRRAGNRLEASVRLSDVEGRILWAERFRGDWQDLPGFQEHAAGTIVAAIPVQVEAAELDRLRHCEIESLTAYELYLHGRAQMQRPSQAAHDEADRLLSLALERNPDLAAAHAELALCRMLWHGQKDSLAHARRAVELDPMMAQGHWMLGTMLQFDRAFDEARFHIDRAASLSPGCTETLAYTGLEYAYAGEASLGVERARQAIRLNPCYPPAYAELLGKAAFVDRAYEDALFWMRKSPDRVSSNRPWLAAAAALAGRPEEAALHAKHALEGMQRRHGRDRLLEMGGPIGCLCRPARFRLADDLQHFERGLALAGLGEAG